MKFIVSTTTLLKSLQTISGVINSSSVLPILEDFLFEIKGKYFVLIQFLLLLECLRTDQRHKNWNNIESQ